MTVEWIFIAILLMVIGLLVFKDRRRNEEIADLAEEVIETRMADRLQQARKEAVEKSNQIVKGKVLEQFSPYFPTFPYNPQDARFLGSPVDFIVFDGLTEGEVRQVVFVEVKTGSADRKLPKREQQVRDCIEKGKVHWVFVQHPTIDSSENSLFEPPPATPNNFWTYLKKLLKTN